MPENNVIPDIVYVILENIETAKTNHEVCTK